MSYLVALIIVSALGAVAFPWIAAKFGTIAILLVLASLSITAPLAIGLVARLIRWANQIEMPRSIKEAKPAPEKVRRAREPVMNPRSARELKAALGILKRPRAYGRKWGHRAPRGVVISGGAGTGKGSVTRYLVKKLGMNLVEVGAEALANVTVWEGAKLIREAYQQAGRGRCTALVLHAEGLNNQHLQDALAQEMSRSKAVTVVISEGATLDGKLQRLVPLEVKLELPGQEERERLYQRFTKPYRKRLEVELEDIATASGDLSGSAIKDICERAAQNAERRGRDTVGYRDFDAALKRFGRMLPPNNRVDAVLKDKCFMCAGDDDSCPVCGGSGWTNIVKRRQHQSA